MKVVGYKLNNGFDDQRQGLFWIKYYIVGFGGDEYCVIYIGESLGVVLGIFYFYFKELLFDQLILMSGFFLVKVKQLEFVEGLFKRVLQFFDILEIDEMV